jgi:hypothetical protein
MESAAIPFCTRVKSLGQIINRRFAWDDQINIVCRQVYFTLNCVWTTASLTSVGRGYNWLGHLLCHCFSTVMAFLPRWLWGCVTSCNWHIIRVRGMSLVFVGLSTYRATFPLGRYYSYRICCQMYRIVSTRKPDYLYRELQFDRSARLSNLIVRRHHYASTAS